MAGQFLRALGCAPAATPDDRQARFALLRSLTADEDLLIVLDNARDEARVRPLLPASASAAVVVTGRQPPLALDGVRPVHLDVLSPDESMELLAVFAGARRCGADPWATRLVARLCGGQPLALRIAGVRFAADDTLSMPAMASRLSDERHRLRHLSVADIGLRPILDHAYRRLSAEARRLLRSLGALSADEAPRFDSDAVLGELVDAQLGQLRAGRLRMHDVVRRYARERHLAEDALNLPGGCSADPAPAAQARDDEADGEHDRRVNRGDDQ